MVALGLENTNNKMIPYHCSGFQGQKRQNMELLKNKFNKNKIKTRLQLPNRNKMH